MTDPKLQQIDLLYKQLIAWLQVERAIVLVIVKGDHQMDQVTADLIARLNTASNTVAAKIQALIDKATANGSATAAEIDAALSPLVANLEAMGADPTNPIPGGV